MQHISATAHTFVNTRISYCECSDQWISLASDPCACASSLQSSASATFRLYVCVACVRAHAYVPCHTRLCALKCVRCWKPDLIDAHDRWCHIFFYYFLHFFIQTSSDLTLVFMILNLMWVVGKLIKNKKSWKNLVSVISSDHYNYSAAF